MAKPKVWSDAELARELARVRDAGRRDDLVGPRAVEVRYDSSGRRIELVLADGCLFAFPAHLAQGLRDAPADALNEVQILGGGYALRWEGLDVDLTVPGILMGRLGSRSWMAREMGRVGGRSTSETKGRAARMNGRKGGRPRK